MPKRPSLIHRTMIHQGYVFTRLGGNLSCWSRAVSNEVEERVYSGLNDAATAPTRLTEPVYVRRIDLAAEERGEVDPNDEVYYPHLSTFLHCRPIMERL